MKPPPFRYEAPAQITDAISLLEDAGDAARVLAGGQSLIPLLRHRLVEPELLVDLRKIESLHQISRSGIRGLQLGAMVTHRALELWAQTEKALLLIDAVEQIGHPSVRAMGTVVGSLAYADPAAEWAAVALVLQGTCRIEGPNGARSVAAEELFAGPHTTTLSSAEVITGLSLTLPAGHSGAAFVEVAPRRGDTAVAGAAVYLRLGGSVVAEARVGLVGLAPTPRRAVSVERALVGAEVESIELAEIVSVVSSDISPVGDVHGSADYRRRIAPVVVARAARMAATRATGSDS